MQNQLIWTWKVGETTEETIVKKYEFCNKVDSTHEWQILGSSETFAIICVLEP